MNQAKADKSGKALSQYRGKVVEEISIESLGHSRQFDRLTIKFTDGSDFVADTWDFEEYQSWIQSAG